jgi:N-acetyl-anhydromuramyl-L-alanine amidase AmpD
MTIDLKKYKLKESNYYSQKYQKTQIIIGHNGRKDMRHFDGWSRRDFSEYKKTSTYSIDRDGKIYQHFDPKYYSDFVGHEQDKCSISICLVNVGWLKYNDFLKNYTDWLGHTYSSNNKLIKKPWRNKDYWFPYTAEQEKSLFYLVDKLCEDFNIERDFIGNNVYNQDVDIYKGIVFRSNYDTTLTDVSPAFNMDLLKTI